MYLLKRLAASWLAEARAGTSTMIPCSYNPLSPDANITSACSISCKLAPPII
jgi:hypothetical protein